jgi:hypothetical protein
VNSKIKLSMRRVRIILAGLGLVFAAWIGSQPVEAATKVYTNESDFITAAGSLPIVLNEFTNSAYFGWLAHPIQTYTNGISYWIASQPPVRLVGFDGALSTHDTNDGILVMFTSTNIMGVGGYFYAADSSAVPISGSVTVSLNDGTVTDISSLSGSPASFVGFLSDGPALTTLTVTNTSGVGYPALSHFSLVSAIPTPSITPARSNVLISWDAAAGFVLQTSPIMEGASWSNVNLAPQLTNNRCQLFVPLSQRAAFFRVVKE